MATPKTQPKTAKAPTTAAPAEGAAALFASAPSQPEPEQPREDGPTLEEYVKAGYRAETYPPQGYAPRTTPRKKFYEAMNSNQFIESNSLMFAFSPYQHCAGIWFGTFVTDKPNEIAALDKLVAEQKHHGVHARVKEITPEEYDKCVKKKAVTLQSLGQSLIHSEVSSESLPSVSHAVPLDSELQTQAPAVQPAVGVESMELGEAKMPAPAEADPEPDADNG